MTHDLSAVADLCRAHSGITKGTYLGQSGRGTEVKDARQTVIAALGVAGEVTAYGDLRDGHRLQPIPAAEWSRLEFFYEDGPDRAGPYQSVVIARADVLRRWPVGKAPVRKPAGAAAGKRSKPAVIAATAAHFDDAGYEKQAEIERWILSKEEEVAASTARAWAKEVIKRIEQKRGQTPDV